MRESETERDRRELKRRSRRKMLVNESSIRLSLELARRCARKETGS